MLFSDHSKIIKLIMEFYLTVYIIFWNEKEKIIFLLCFGSFTVTEHVFFFFEKNNERWINNNTVWML